MTSAVETVINIFIGGGLILVFWALILLIKRAIFRKKPVPPIAPPVPPVKQSGLTDIKFPKKTAPIKKREPLLPKLWSRLIWLLLAPFRLLRAVLTAIFNGFKALIVYFFSGLKFLFLSIVNLFLSIVKALKNFFLVIWGNIKKFVLFFIPKSLAGWIVLILALIFIWQLYASIDFPVVNKHKWQAVFLTNNQVYFGHLKELNNEYTVLKNAYYLRPASDSPDRVDLVKLGDELHGPEQNMYIPKNQILFWENLKPDSQVVRLIKQLQN